MIKLALPLLVWLVAVPASASTPQAQASWDKGDFRQAFAEAFEPALAGDPQAQFMLGEAYRLGRSVEPNALAAQEWYMRAAKQGHVAAATELGRIYLQLRNMRDAVPWLTMAASHDDPRAMATLAAIYYNGEGIDRDLPLAYSLMHKAADRGLAEAKQQLSMMDDVAQPVDVSNPPTELAASQPVLPPPPIPARVPTPTPVAVAVALPVVASPGPPSGKFVRVAIASPEPATPRRRGVRVQIGAYRSLQNARRAWLLVAARAGGGAKMSPIIVRRGGLYRVQARVENASAARAFTARLTAVRWQHFVARHRLRRA